MKEIESEKVFFVCVAACIIAITLSSLVFHVVKEIGNDQAYIACLSGPQASHCNEFWKAD